MWDSFTDVVISVLGSASYVTGHIWACPPGEGDDYIFHCHPPDQKIPKPKRLQEWYKKMLDKAFAERIIHDYKVRKLSQILSLKNTLIFNFCSDWCQLLCQFRTFLSKQQKTDWRVPMNCHILRVTFGLTYLRRVLRSLNRRRRNARRRKTQLLLKQQK